MGNPILKDAIYLSIDANDTGKTLERYILSDRLEELKIFSEKLSLNIDNIRKVIVSSGGIVYMSGGDNIFAKIDDSVTPMIIFSTAQISIEGPLDFSVGIGKTPSDAYLALKNAKANRYFLVRYEFGDIAYSIMSPREIGENTLPSDVSGTS